MSQPIPSSENEFSLKSLLPNMGDPNNRIASLPLQFEYMPVQILSKEFTKLNSRHQYRIHYLGPRPVNSCLMHKKYACPQGIEEEAYGALSYRKYAINLRRIINSPFINQKLQNNHYYKSAMFYRAFEGMNPTLDLQDQLIFNSAFESGNLDCVIKLQQKEYDLFLRIDSNTRGHTSWYYFSVKNMSYRGSATFHICNLTKPCALYEQGMRPFVFSRLRYDREGISWHQGGAKCVLDCKEFRYEDVYEKINPGLTYRLTFDYEFEDYNDQIFFAYSIPYTYSQLKHDIANLPAEFVETEVLVRSLTGVDVPIILISDKHNSEKDSSKKNAILTARVHPGQSNCSYLLKGFMEHICGCSKEAVDLRKRMNFFVVPMLNPDGVIMGNSRTSAAGKDLNRQFHSSRRELYPQIWALKQFTAKLQRRFGVFMYFDFHGHSRKKNTFMYGPAYSVCDAEYYKCRVLPRLIEKINNAFRFHSCSFTIAQDKKTTARAVMLNHFKIPYTYTIESSVGLYYDAELMKTLIFQQSIWHQIGVSICSGVSQFIVAYEEYELLMKQRRLTRQRKRYQQETLSKKSYKKVDDTKKFFEDQLDESTLYITGLKKPNLFMDLLQEVKSCASSLKQQDSELSSDDHDGKEDLQAFKLAQFNNLVIQNNQKEMQYSNRKIQEEDMLAFKQKETAQELEEQPPEKEENTQKAKKSTLMTENHRSSSRETLCSTIKVEQKQRLIVDQKMVQKRRTRESNKNFIISNRERFNLAARTLFPVVQDKCEIVSLPKNIQTMRKSFMKARHIINNLWQQKIRDEEPAAAQRVVVNPVKKMLKMEHQLANFKFLDAEIQQRSKIIFRSSTSHLNRNQEDSQRRKLSQRSSSQNVRNDPESLISSIQIDNMAITIRTFRKPN